MPTAIWGEPEPRTEERYPLSLLTNLLQQMMGQFGASGAVIALHDAGIDQMVIRLHMRVRRPGAAQTFPRNGPQADGKHSSGLRPRTTIDLSDPSSPAFQRGRRSSQPLEHTSPSRPEVEFVTSTQVDELFPPGTAYPKRWDLIGYTWRNNEICVLRHDEYLDAFHGGRELHSGTGIMPSWYMSIPVQEPPLTVQDGIRKQSPAMLGVVVLYQTAPGAGFYLQQRYEAQVWAERLALYIQNDSLRRLHLRTRDYMQGLQRISSAFPNVVRLSDLLEHVYQFVTGVVDVSSLLLTIYDRDTHKIYDVFAVDGGRRIERLLEQPRVATEEERPVWWRVTQQKKQTLMLSPAEEEQEQGSDGGYGEYEELLLGSWGDQRKAQTFLLLPMKMFTRVVGSLCLTSTRPRAYSLEEILVLETMVQIITVSIENAKLYERSRLAVLKARQREESLAAMNSALLSISTVLNLRELLHKFVENVAKLVQAEMCTFFQLTGDSSELIAQAIYDTTGRWKEATQSADSLLDSGGSPEDWVRGTVRPADKDKHDELIAMIRLPFKGSIVERLVEAETFFTLDSQMVEELAQVSSEGGAIFLRETDIQNMLMLPVRYQTEIVGILAVHTPHQNRLFKPEEVGVLLAICAQAASAIRNAQLFEEIQEAYAELKHMDKLKDEFIVTASHELRTPLSAICGYASLLRRQSARITPQQVLRYASKIAGSAQQLIDLVNNMTEAAKMGALEKKNDFQPGPVQVLAAAEMASNMLSINIEQKISLEIEPDLWVYCDAMSLRQVLTNLLDNAAKYSRPAGCITVSARALKVSQLPDEQVDYSVLADGNDPEVVQVRVRDEGEGIPVEDQERIFEKFVRASRSLTTPVRGSGLGLYICRRLIEAMGGRLWLEESIPQRGSVFSFYLPLIEAPVEASEKEEDEPGDEYA